MSLRHLSRAEDICNKIIETCCPEVLKTPMPVPVERIMEAHYQLVPKLVTLVPDNSILGETIFVDGYRQVWICKNGELLQEFISVRRGEVLLDEYVYSNMIERSSFTIAHELGHWQLHQSYFCSKPSSGYINHDKLEAEANEFAGTLLLPREPVRIATKEILAERHIDWRCFRQLQERKNQIAFLLFSEEIAKTFKVSKETARLRMIKLFDIQ